MSNTKCYGAVLEHAEDSGRDFDMWVITEDFETILKAPDSDVVLLPEDETDKEALERLIRGKHEAPLGCTVIVECFAPSAKEAKAGHRRRRYRIYSVRGWRVLKWPLVEDSHDDPISITRVRGLCAEHGAVLVHGSAMAALRVEAAGNVATMTAGDEALRTYGFVVTTSGDLFKIRWNALSAAMQDWRRASKETLTKLMPHFSEEALAKVGYCVNPTNWPSGHPYQGMLSGRDDFGFNGRDVDRYGNQVRRGSKRHRVEYSSFKIDEILALIALNKKLCPKLSPWLEIRNYNRGSYEPALQRALEACFENIHAVEARCRQERVVTKNSDDFEKDKAKAAEVALRFCRWLRAQARALKITVPKPVKLPPKPTKKTAIKLLGRKAA